MDELSAIQLVTVGATFLCAGAVKGVTGMGLPTVAMAVLGAVISPLAAASLLIVPSFVTNLWQFLVGPSCLSIVRRLWPMMLAITFTTMLSAGLLVAGDTRTTTAALGASLIVYAGYTLFARPLEVPRANETWLSPLMGGATGLVTGGTGILVIPAVPYLQSLALGRDELIQALGLSFAVSTLAMAAGLGIHGAYSVQGIGASILAVLPALAGMWAGQKLRKRIDPVLFRRLFLASLGLLGAEMLGRAFW